MEDLRFIPRIFSLKRDGITLSINGESFTLTKKDVLHQLVNQYDTMYFDDFARRISETYDRFLQSVDGSWTADDSLYLRPSRYGSENEIMPDVFKEKIINHCKPLKERAADRKARRKIKKKRHSYIKKLNHIYEAREKGHKKFLRSLKGKMAVRNPENMDWSLTFPLNSGDNKKLPSFQFLNRKSAYALLSFDSLGPLEIIDLPVPVSDPCRPLDRFTYFKKMKGSGFMKFPYDKYRPQTKRRRQKKFELFFPRNESTVEDEKVREIIQFLNDSSYTILRAKVFAYASIEGPEDNNIRLQKERAGVMLDALQKSNDEQIIIDTVATAENWDLFYDQIKKSSYDSLSSLKKNQVKQYLENDAIRDSLEPLLNRQRVSILYLLLAEKLEEDEKVQVAYGQYFREIKKINRIMDYGRIIPDIRRAIAIRQYLEESMVNKTIPEHDVCVRLDRFNDYAHSIVNFYALVSEYNEGHITVCHPIEDVLINAHVHLINKLRQYSDNWNKLYYFQRQAIDLQLFAYDQIQSGKIPADFFCLLNYPDEHPYYPMIINKIDFENTFFNSLLFNTPCYLESGLHPIWLPDIELAMDRNDEPVSKYYYFLKKRIVENDREIRNYVIRSDDLYEFDLYEFLKIGLENWNVEENRYYDTDLDYTRLKFWFGKLQQSKSQLCEKAILRLYVLLHQKIAGMARHGNKYVNDAGISLSYLASFYTAHESDISPETALNIAQTLLSYNNYFYHNEALDAARYFLQHYLKTHPEQPELRRFYQSLTRKN
jgi:hypothetical protein